MNPGGQQDASSQTRAANSVLIRQLTRGARTEAQLREALQRKAVPTELAEATIARFRAAGLIDDAAYAAALIRSDQAAGGLSRRRAMHRMRERGVPEDVARESVANIDEDLEEQAALEFARRRAPRLAGLEIGVQRHRMIGLLARRGYDPDTVRRVVTEVLGEDLHDG